MMRRLIAGARRALGLQAPGRNMVVFPDDIFIVSYPKSGNTWTRFLIGNLVHPESPADFSNINTIIPDPEALSKRRLARMPRPRIIKSHQYFDPRYRKIIYVVRDPRDVALSQYHFHRKRKLLTDDSPLDAFVTRFVAGVTSIYGSWGENVASWVATREHDEDFLLLRYEDMMDNTVRELSRVASFLAMDVTTDDLRLAAERSSSDQMRKLENEQAHLWSSTRETRSDVPFVRTAKAGGWKGELPDSSIMEIETAWSPIMRWLGYELSTSRTSNMASPSLVETLLNGSAQ
jgi:hypothetical protein